VQGLKCPLPRNASTVPRSGRALCARVACELHALTLLTEGVATLAAHRRLNRRIAAAPGQSHVVFAVVVTAVERADAGAVRIDSKIARMARRAG
jgi:hypothetical protein